MQYFDATAGKPERIGQVIGDVFSASIYIFLLGLMLSHFA